MLFLDSLKKEKDISISSGQNVEVYVLEDIANEIALGEWATHFRQNYCVDELIDSLRDGTGYSRKEYLMNLKFPDKSEGFGPGTRSGDFAELLVSDFLEYVHGFEVPRDRYNCKFNRNSSTQGTDVIGLKMLSGEATVDDELVVFEVKSLASKSQVKNRLQDAVDDSKKDYLRKAETLNAIKQKALERGDKARVEKVRRFQNEIDRPYTMRYGAAAVYDLDAYSEQALSTTVAHSDGIHVVDWLIVVKRKDLMTLIHEIYERAADC